MFAIFFAALATELLRGRSGTPGRSSNGGHGVMCQKTDLSFTFADSRKRAMSASFN